MTHAPTADGWRRSFADQSQSEFANHRPLTPVLRFSAEIRDRLAGVIPADYFLDAHRRVQI